MKWSCVSSLADIYRMRYDTRKQPTTEFNSPRSKMLYHHRGSLSFVMCDISPACAKLTVARRPTKLLRRWRMGARFALSDTTFDPHLRYTVSPYGNCRGSRRYLENEMAARTDTRQQRYVCYKWCNCHDTAPPGFTKTTDKAAVISDASFN